MARRMSGASGSIIMAAVRSPEQSSIHTTPPPLDSMVRPILLIACVVGLTQLGDLLLQLLRIGLDIKAERTGEHGAHQVDAAHGRRLVGLQCEHLELGRTQAIATTDSGAQVVIGDRDVEEVLELFLEQAALLVPAFTLVGAVATLRQVQNVRALELVE